MLRCRLIEWLLPVRWLGTVPFIRFHLMKTVSALLTFIYVCCLFWKYNRHHLYFIRDTSKKCAIVFSSTNDFENAGRKNTNIIFEKHSRGHELNVHDNWLVELYNISFFQLPKLSLYFRRIFNIQKYWTTNCSFKSSVAVSSSCSSSMSRLLQHEDICTNCSRGGFMVQK